MADKKSRREKLTYQVYKALLYGVLYLALTPLVQQALIAQWPGWLKRYVGPVDISLIYATVIVTVIVSIIAWMLSRKKKAQQLAFWMLATLVMALTLLAIILR